MRSNRLLLILGLLIAGGAAVFAYLYMNTDPGNQPGVNTPTPVPPPVEVITVREDMQAGTVLTATVLEEMLTFEEVPLEEYQQSDYIAVTDMPTLNGMKLLVPVIEGSRLRLAQVGPPGLAEIVEPNRRAYPLLVDSLSGIGDLISEGDSVDVLATYPLNIIYIRPSVSSSGADTSGLLTLGFTEDVWVDNTTKTVLQDIKVLEILRPPPPPAGTPVEGADPNAPPPPTGGPSLPQGSWVVILSVTDQQAEVIKYSVDREAVINLALRRSGDRSIENTTGITFDILSRNFGVPIPRPPDVLRAQFNETPGIPTATVPAVPTATPTP